MMEWRWSFHLAVEVGRNKGKVDVAKGRDEEGGGIGEGGEDLIFNGDSGDVDGGDVKTILQEIQLEVGVLD